MAIKAKQTIFEVEPLSHPTIYSEELFEKNAFKELLRFNHKVEGVLTLWESTNRAFESKPFAFGFIDYKYP